MEDFVKSIDDFLAFNRYEILHGNGNISNKKAKEKAISEYTEFNKNQNIFSDFDKVIKEIEEGGKSG